jgi:Flp pilus assembly protein TadG
VSRRLFRRDSGQSLAEFAILLPVLMGIVIGIFEFGRAWNIDQVVTNAAREGARLAVIPSSSQTDVRAAVQSRISDAGLDPAVANIAILGMGNGTGTPAAVEVRYPYEFTFLGPIIAFLGDGGGDTPGAVTLRSRITMRNE